MSIAAKSSGPATILYIEDDDASRSLVTRLLNSTGHRVLTAADGLAGIDAARRHRPDLILMDLKLPHLSGEAVTTRLKSIPSTQDIPIVALTAQTLPGDRERALVAGCIGFINKPIDVDRLPAQIDEFLDGRRDELSEPLARQFHVEYNRSLVARLEAKVRQLEEANRQLRRIDKMKNDFINLTSHEVRTPLTLVQGYASLLEDAARTRWEGDPDAEIPMYVDSLVLSVGRLGEILGEILSVSRIATGQLEPAHGPVRLKEIVDEAVAEIMSHCQDRQISLSVDQAGWPPIIQGDGELLLIAIRNLLSNALKYTPDGGRVGVSVNTFEGNVELIIEDSGIGIDPEEHQLIFEQFYVTGDVQLHSTSKTNFKGGGLGLGLAIARGVIEAHAGKIWVQSSGRDESTLPGSRFHVLLPLDQALLIPSPGFQTSQT